MKYIKNIFYTLMVILLLTSFKAVGSRKEAETDFDKIFSYFSEIALKSEYGGKEAEGIIRKWETPIKICLTGKYTEEDYRIIRDHICLLNSIEGVPEISITKHQAESNVILNFITQKEMDERSDINEIAWGVASVWWGKDYIIDSGEILIVNDEQNQEQRHHSIIEEMTQILGFMNDSSIYEDSIFQSSYTETVSLSEMDIILIRMLYSSGVTAGMKGAHIYNLISSWFYENYYSLMN